MAALPKHALRLADRHRVVDPARFRLDRVDPADHKWYTRLVVAAAIVDALEDLRLEYPGVDSARRRELAAARQALESE